MTKSIAAMKQATTRTGDDTLIGDDGAGTIDAGAGIDTIFAGTGDDIFTGGAGDDIFESGDFGNDLITDFERGDAVYLIGQG